MKQVGRWHRCVGPIKCRVQTLKPGLHKDFCCCNHCCLAAIKYSAFLNFSLCAVLAAFLLPSFTTVDASMPDLNLNTKEVPYLFLSSPWVLN